MHDFRSRLILGISTLILCTPAPCSAAATDTVPPAELRGILVAPSSIAPAAAPLADGFAEWTRQEIMDRGIPVLRPPPGASTPVQLKTRDALAMAAASRAEHTLLIDMRWDNGMVTVDYRLYEGTNGQVRSGRSIAALPGELVAGSSRGLWETLYWVKTRAAQSSGPRTPSMTVDELSAASRTVSLIQQGRLGRARRAAGSSPSPVLESLRQEIAALAQQPSTPLEERARWMAASGQAAAAWALLATEVDQRPESAAMQLAAGEVLLERGDTEASQRYFSRVLELEPKNPEASLGLGQVLAHQGRTDKARKAFRHSAHYDAANPAPLEAWAAIEEGADPRQAKVLLAAGQRHADQMSTEAAHRDFQRAIELEPRYGPVSHERDAALHARVGNHAEALQDYQQAIETGEATEARLLGLARSQRGADRVEDAEKTYVTLLDTSAGHVEANVELAAIYRETDRDEEAVGRLMKAVELTPHQPETQLGLARALESRGRDDDVQKAIELYAASDAGAPLGARDLTRLAGLQRQQGDLTAAQRSLERAIEVRPTDVEANRDLADVLEHQGNAAHANLIRERLAFYGSSDFTGVGDADGLAFSKRIVRAGELSESLPALVESIRAGGGAVTRVAILGTREPQDWISRLVSWTYPRVVDFDRIEAELGRALAPDHEIIKIGGLEDSLAAEFDVIFQFGPGGSLDLATVVEVNLSLAADAVFAGRVFRSAARDGAKSGSCAAAPFLELQLRRLDGQRESTVRVVEQSACLRGGMWGSYATWNLPFVAVVCLLVMLACYPFVRGWGTVAVRFELPPKTRALFSVTISKREAKLKDRSEKARAANSHFFEKQLRAKQVASLGRYTKWLEGDEVRFPWIPARKEPYYVIVRGPLMDLATNTTIGEFIQERTVRAERRKTTWVPFDLRVRESAVTIAMTCEGKKANRARVGVLGAPSSYRFAPEGKGFVYAPLGEQILQIGFADRVAEISLELEEPVPVSMEIDLSTPSALLFSGCPKAVTPYLDGDLKEAAEQLEAAGLTTEAEHVRSGRHPTISGSQALTSSSIAETNQPDPIDENPDPNAPPATFEDSMGDNASFLQLDGDDDIDDVGPLDVD